MYLSHASPWPIAGDGSVFVSQWWNRYFSQPWLRLVHGDLKVLGMLWCTRTLWISQRLQCLLTIVIVGFWIRQGDGVLHGRGPLMSWMISAEIAIFMITWLTWDVFRQSEGRQRDQIGLLLFQFLLIIVGNTTIVIMQVVRGMTLKPWDIIIFRIDLAGLYVLALCMALGWLKPKSAWAKCWYSVALKAMPQVVQAIWVFSGKGTLDKLGAVLLVVQATGRFAPPVLAYIREGRRTATSQTKALSVGTAFDLATTLGIFGAVMQHE